jgi:hypothetical protein
LELPVAELLTALALAVSALRERTEILDRGVPLMDAERSFVGVGGGCSVDVGNSAADWALLLAAGRLVPRGEK